MASPINEIYVDPSIASDSGSGTPADPYGDLQWALNQTTRNVTVGDRFNVKSGAAEVLTAALDLTSYGAPAYTAPLFISGYTNIAGDGGMARIDCNTNKFLTVTGNGISLFNLEIHNGPVTGSMVDASTYGKMFNCYLHDCTATGLLVASSYYYVMGCRFENCGDTGFHMMSVTTAYQYTRGCYFDVGATRTPDNVINAAGTVHTIEECIIVCDSTTTAIKASSNFDYRISENTILSDGGSGIGIDAGGSNLQTAALITGNYVEGFSGGGGEGIQMDSAGGGSFIIANNRVFDCATEYNITNEHCVRFPPDRILSQTGLAKTGARTYENRFNYFAPVLDSVEGSGMYSAGRSIGAVQSASPLKAHITAPRMLRR